MVKAAGSTVLKADAPLRTRRRMSTRQAIAEAALELFEEQGYASTTVEQIAESAGISLRTFYRHCSSKDEVLTSHLTAGPAELAAAVRENGDLPLLEAVIAAFVAVSENPVRRREVRIITNTPALRAAWLAAAREAQDDLVTVISSRPPMPSALHARAQAAAITGVLSMVSEVWASSTTEELEPLTREALNVVSLRQHANE